MRRIEICEMRIMLRRELMQKDEEPRCASQLRNYLKRLLKKVI